MCWFICFPIAGVSTLCSDNEHTMAHSPCASETAHKQFQLPVANTVQDQLRAPAEETDEGTRQDNKHLSSQREHMKRRAESHVRPPPQCESSDQDAHNAELRQRNRSTSNSSYHAQQYAAENQTKWQDTDPQQQQQQKPILDIWSFSAYTCIRKFCYSTTLVAAALTALICMQIFLVSVDCYESYSIRSEHSQCSCSFPYPWLVTAALRITSRFAFPLLLSIVFWRHVVCRKTRAAAEGQPVSKVKFAAEIEKEHNQTVVIQLYKKFWDSSVRPSNDISGKQLLKSIRDQINTELTWMCITSLLQSALLVTVLFAFHLIDAQDVNWFDTSFWLGVVDTLSFGIILAVSGVMLSFYFLESKIKHYVRAIHTFPSTSRTLRDKARTTENCITSRWYPLEIGIRYASVVIPTTLVMSWASDIPLSCGFSVTVEAITNHSAAACWLGFIAVVTIGQVMVTSPFRPFYIRWTGLSMEAVIIFIFYCTFPTYKWMQLTHILYAIVPISYLIWYHIASIRRQWLAVNRVKDENPTYVSRLASRTGLLILILATLAASLRTEYNHLHPSAIGKYSTADISVQPSLSSQSIIPAGISSMKYERALLQQLAEKHNAMVFFVEDMLENHERDDCVSSRSLLSSRQEHCNG